MKQAIEEDVVVIQNLTDIGEGVCVISASRDREFSQEGREWGGGHGVFSYYLVEGLIRTRLNRAGLTRRW